MGVKTELVDGIEDAPQPDSVIPANAAKIIKPGLNETTSFN